MKNEAAVIDPIHYLEMIFGRYVNDKQDLEVRRLNYFCFLGLVTGFTATGTFKDADQYNIASAMCDRLKEVLALDFNSQA